MKTIRIAVIFACINMIALDAIFYTVDRELRASRDMICGQIDRDRLVEQVTQSVAGSENFYVTATTWNMSNYSTVSLASKNTTVNFYGCDANGHRYRLWRKQN